MVQKGRFVGKVVWITGGGTGMGRAMAMQFAREGAKVALSGRRRDRLEEAAARCTELGAETLVLPCDVCDADGIAHTVQAVVDRFGQLDVAVANAGQSVGGRIEALTAEQWRAQLEVNVVGVAMTCRHALPHLRQTGGRVAITCSVSGLMTSPGMGAYHASKYAARAIGQTLAMELEGSGVSCTLLHPGFVEKEDEVPGVRPRAFMWQPEQAGPLMVDAIHHRRLEYVFSPAGQVGAFLGKHAPRFVHYMVSWAARPKPTEEPPR